MDNKPVVSVLVPCYNVEKKMIKFMESILHQTYSALELVFVDDGSTDDTKDVIEAYRKPFEDRGYMVKYIYQNNGGPGSATNTGLKMVTGDYLIWPDADDWLETDSIEIRVKFLEDHPEYAIVTSNSQLHMANEIDEVGECMFAPVPQYFYNENQFRLLLRYKSIFCPICHMVRMSDFLESNPAKDIFPSRGGQNFQMLLPIYYKRKRYFMNKVLCHYVVYENSHSRQYNTYEKQKTRFDELRKILIETLNRIEMPRIEKLGYLSLIYLDDAVKRIKMYPFWIAKRLMGEKMWEKLKALLGR